MTLRDDVALIVFKARMGSGVTPSEHYADLILAIPEIAEALQAMKSSGQKCNELLDEIHDLHEEEAKPFDERFGKLPSITTSSKG